VTTSFAVGRKALGLCDRCARQYLLHELKDQIVDRKKTGLMVCPECLDEDHPQYQLGETPVFDPQALRDPRPDQRNDVTNSPQFVGFTALGAPIFTTYVTPASGNMVGAGLAPTIRRG
jgi:hypothetical protein